MSALNINKEVGLFEKVFEVAKDFLIKDDEKNGN